MSAPKLYLVTWDDHQGCCAIMCRDTDCEGAICAMGDKPALFTSRAAARKDSERLSWLEKNPKMIQGYDEGDPEVGVFPHWYISRHIGKYGENLWEPVSHADTLRDAIDAAKQSKP